MDHVAIMKKSWGLTDKIRSGQKTIESRWYKSRVRPWNAVQAGDGIYFKNSGEPIKLRATVAKVKQIECLTPRKVKDILEQYAQEDGIERQDTPLFYERFKNRNYCLLIFLKSVETVEPFGIDKKGFGAMSAWITVSSIENIKK